MFVEIYSVTVQYVSGCLSVYRQNLFSHAQFTCTTNTEKDTYWVSLVDRKNECGGSIHD